MADIRITLPDETVIPGNHPVVIIGPNGSGKTRLSRRLGVAADSELEFVNALRSTRISAQLPAMSQLQARQQHDSTRNNARNQPWEISSDFDVILAQLLAEDGDSARGFRAAVKAGGEVDRISATALEVVQEVWSVIFPGRSLEWKDWSPVIHNEHDEVLTYSANQMSDGERAALYLLAKTLLAGGNRVMVIDEPETHFHSQLAIRLWDAIEDRRPDIRFVYVTHDLNFALSREPAHFVMADPRSGLTTATVDDALPDEIRREILGAASFSYFASRIVFCEGNARSLDKRFYSAWFSGRDTVVIPVGSSESVRQCVRSLNESRLIANLQAIGMIDQDFKSDEFLTNLGPGIHVLPLHEIEAIICLPPVVQLLGVHLGKDIDLAEVDQTIRQSITDEMCVRVAYERTKTKLLNLTQDRILAKPTTWDKSSLGEHFRLLSGNQEAQLGTDDLFSSELQEVEQLREAGSIEDVLRVFPSKQLTGGICSLLGLRGASDVFTLIAHALNSLEVEANADNPLSEGLMKTLNTLGLPGRHVPERPFTAQA